MPRPKKFDRTEAVSTAMREIWRDGYEAASVQHLSEVLGITRSSFYNAFGSRDDLFHEALAAYRAVVPELPSPDPSAGLVLPRLTSLARAMCRFNAEHGFRGCMITNSVAELCPAGEGPGAELGKIMRTRINRLEKLFERAKAQRELPATANSRTLALAYQNLLFGLNVLGKALQNEADLWRIAEATLRGLAIYAPPGSA
ncbi:MAG: TetR/AcrR family transcriptional regulator [Bryobacteraceae bacterium]